MKANFSKNESTQLQRILGLKEALAIVVGRIIGSGIFRTPGTIFIVVSGVQLSKNHSEFAPNHLTLFFLVWFIGGVCTLLNAICYAEMVSLLPKSGGPYVFLKHAYPEIITFLRGWAMFFVAETASIVAVAIVFQEFLSQAIGNDTQIKKILFLISPYLLIWIFTLSSCFGVKLSGWLQDILGILKITVLVAMVGIFFGISGSMKNLDMKFTPQKWQWDSFLTVFAGLRYAFFSYSGWEGATYIAEEVRKPKRNLPLSLFIGISLVMLLYILINASYIYQLGSIGVMEAGKNVAVVAMERALGLHAKLLLIIFILISTASNVSTQIFVKARTWFAMARDKLFFAPLSQLNTKYHTPNTALIYQALWASMLLSCSLLYKNSYEALIDYFSFTSALFNILTLIALPILRKKMSAQERTVEDTFKVPFLPFVLFLVLFIQISFLLVTFFDKPIESLVGVILTLSGLFFYYRKFLYSLKQNRWTWM